MDPVTVRPARADEVDGVLAFWRQAAEGTDRADTAEGVAALLARDPGALLLAESGGRLVGCVVVGWDGWRCHLYRLAVRPDLRRRGIATRLLVAAEERAAALGAARVDAMVLDGNDLAHPAWAAAGYRRQPQWSRWVKHLRAPGGVARPGPAGGGRGGHGLSREAAPGGPAEHTGAIRRPAGADRGGGIP